MKLTKKLLGFAAIIAAIGFLALPLTGCGGGDDGGGHGDPSSHGITLLSSGVEISSYAFPTVNTYEQFSSLLNNSVPITIKNTSGKATGPLNITLSGANTDRFGVSSYQINVIQNLPSGIQIKSIAAGQTTMFFIWIYPNMNKGTYTATVNVSGTNGSSASLSLSWTTNFGNDPEPSSSIRLSPNYSYNFNNDFNNESGYLSYYDNSTVYKVVTVYNDDSEPTGDLTVALSGDNASSFILSTTSISSIEEGETGSFIVKPVNGLTPGGTYTATITVSGANGISASLNVSINIAALRTFTLSEGELVLQYNDELELGTGMTGYDPADHTRTITVTSTGNAPTGDLTVTLEFQDNDQFTLSTTLINSIPVGGTATFTVAPKAELPTNPNTGPRYNNIVTVRSEQYYYNSQFYVYFKVSDVPVYGIGLSETSTYTFPGAFTGYSEQATKTVTVTNEGNQLTGNLTVALSGTGASSFTLSKTSIDSIGNNSWNNNSTFTVRPNTGLAAGTYTATVTVSGANDISASFIVSFTVTAAIDSISLSTTGTHTFTGTYIEGYTTAPTALSVNVTNTGNRATGTLTAALSGTNPTSFTLSKTSISSIIVSGIDTFTVRPNTGLSAGTYAATVTVSGANGISASFNVSFTVYTASAAPGILLSVTGTHTFASAVSGYTSTTPLTVTVNNSSTGQPTGALTVALSGTSAGSFTLSKTSINSIAVNGTDTFTVQPTTGLSNGSYTATVTVSGSNVTSRTFNVSFTVSAPTYSISLSQTTAYTFTAVDFGYSQQTPLTVTVNNTGNMATGALTAALSGTNAGSFTLSSTSISSINTGATATFTVRPNTGLAVGTYTATVTVSGGNGITSRTFNVSFTVRDVTYIITGSGTSFTATRGGTTIGTASQPIQTVIEAIRTHANGNAAIIQFSNTTTALNIGTASVTFNNTGGTWGPVTLLGKITGSPTSATSGTVAIADNVSVTSSADIANTATDTSSTRSKAVYFDSTGTLNITGGTVTASGTYSYAIYNVRGGTVNISGGEVRLTGQNGIAVYNNSAGKVTVSGTTTNVQSSNINIYEGAIVNAGLLEVQGGTVQNTRGDNSTTEVYAVYNVGGTVNISGGEISAKVANTTTAAAGRAIRGGTVYISGGEVSVTTGYGIYQADAVTVSDNGKVTATTGTGIYNSSAVNITGGEVSATTGTAVSNSVGVNISGGKVSATTGYAVNYGTVTVSGTALVTSAGSSTISSSVTITGGTVENTGSGYAVSSSSATISGGTVGEVYVSGTSGTVTISGGTVSSSGYALTHNGTSNYAQDPGPTINITGGTVSTTGDGYNGRAVNVTGGKGNINISGGTVSATTGIAIHYAGTTTGTPATVTVSGTALVTSANPTTTQGTIMNRLSNNTSNTVINISGGTVENTAARGNAVYDNSSGGQISISGGIVRATTGKAVHAIQGFTISGGVVTSANTTTTEGTVYCNSSNALEITGGVVSNTAASGNAIYGVSNSLITLRGGVVQVLDGYAICRPSNPTGSVKLRSNAVVFAKKSSTTTVFSPALTTSDFFDDYVVVVWTGSGTSYTANSSSSISTSPSTTNVNAVWAKDGTKNGIRVTNGTTNTFIEVAGVTVN